MITQSSFQALSIEQHLMVAVDSAGHAYQELPVNQNLMLCAPGNDGKSSLINGIRLALIARSSLKKQDKWFGFRSSKGVPYSDQAVFNHYFPSQHSLIILETSSFIGGRTNHCQILFANKASNLTVSRIMTPLRYDQFRHLIWQCESDDELGVGGAVLDMTGPKLFAQLKVMDKRTVLINSDEKLRERLFSNEFLDAEAMRYAVFPLIQNDTATINSFHAVVRLMYDMRIEAFPGALAHLIEASKKEEADHLQFDVTAFLDKHRELESRQAQLNQLKGQQKQFTELNRKFHDMLQLSGAETAFLQYIEQLDVEKEQRQQTAFQAAQTKVNAVTELNRYKSIDNDANSRLRSEKMTRDARQKEREQLEREIQKAELELACYPSIEMAEVLEILEKDLTNSNKNLAAMEDAEACVRRIHELSDTCHRYRRQLVILEELLSKPDRQLREQLSQDTFQRLCSINKKIALANPGRELRQEERQAIESFTHLLDDQGLVFEVFGVSLAKQDQMEEIDYQAQRDELAAQLCEDEKTLQQLQNTLHDGSMASEQKKNALRREIQSTEQTKSDIEGLTYNRVRLRKLVEQELPELAHRLSEAEQRVSEAKAAHDSAANTADNAKEAYRIASKAVDEAVALEQRCDNLLARHRHLKGVAAPSGAPQLSLNNVTADQMEQELDDYQSYKQSVVSRLQRFILEGFLEDEDQVLGEAPALAAIKRSFQRLAERFDNLPAEEEILDKQHYEHATSIQALSDMLVKQHNYIKDYQQGINTDLAHAHVNNLRDIKLRIGIDPRFSNLVSFLESVDVTTGSQLPTQFYARLEAFAAQFFRDGQAKRLTMDKLIISTDYEYELEDGSRETKEQSNSTTSLINLNLVKILLHRVRAPGCRSQMPVVLDEAASVDISQYPAMLERLAVDGFRLLTATTNSVSSELRMLMSVLPITAMQTARPFSVKRRSVCWGGPELVVAVDSELLADVDQAQLDFAL